MVIVDLKSVKYMPERRDKEGVITKQSHFVVQVEIPNNTDARKMLSDCMLSGKAGIQIELDPIQQRLINVVESENDVQKQNEGD